MGKRSNMHAHHEELLKNIIQFANDNDIVREDVVSLIQDDEGFFLVYYK